MDPGAAEQLSKTELEVLRLVATGATNREIARERGISEATVKKHLTNINTKLGTGNRTEATRRALEMGLVEVETPGGTEAGHSGDAARKLAAELERTRRRARRNLRWVVAGAILAVVAVAAVLAAPSGPAPPPTPTPRPPPPRWADRLNLPTARSGLALVAGEEGLLAIAGADASGPLSDTLLYGTRGPEWVGKASKPTAVTNVDARAVQGLVVVPGGCLADGSATELVEVYDPRRDAWTKAAPLPAPRCGYALAEHEGRLFLFGGRTSSAADSAADTVWRYDPGVDSWTAEEPLPRPRSDLAAATLGDEIHVVGGLDPDGEATADHWIFDPNPGRERWKTLPGEGLPEARAGHRMVGVLARLYLVGGGQEAPLDTLTWDSEAPGWSHDEQLLPNPGPPSPQRGLGLVFVDERRLVVAGGLSANGRLLDLHQVFDVAFRLFVPGG